MAESTFHSFKSLISAAWLATCAERLRFFAFIALFILAYSIDLIVPWTIGYVLGVFVQHGFTEEAYEKSLWGIGAYVALRFLNTFCHHYARYLQNTVAFSVRMHTLRRIFAAILKYPLCWHVAHHSGENLSRLQRSTGAVDNTIATYVWQIVEGLVKVVFASAAIFALDFWVAVNVFSMGLVTILIMILFNRKLVRNIRENNLFYDKINRTCMDYLSNVITVKTLKLEDAAYKYLRVQQPAGLQISKTIAKFQELKWGSVGLGYGLVLGSSLLIYFHGHRGFAGPFDVAQVYVLMNYLDKIFQAISSFTGYYGGIIEASTAFESGDEILRGAELIEPEQAERRIAAGWQKISLNQLEFSYVAGEITGLRAMEFEFRRGEKIALVGPSGGGKSTLLKILGGMLMPERAVIRVDGNSGAVLEDIARLSLLLPQEPEIFSETVRYNLSMGRDFKTEEMQFFIALCKVQDIITKLPQGWESDMAESGMNLSVGEKQRVALARGLLRASEKEILLLDEPTSSLDPMTEKQIFYSMFYHFKNCTIITACHRLALVPLFDTIVFVREGRIEETGGFAELLQKRGAFYYAWEDYQRKVVKKQTSEGRGD